MEELMITTQTMGAKELFDEKAQSLKGLLEETVKPPPQKNFIKKKRKDEVGKAKACENIPSLIKQRKGKDKVSVGSPTKIPLAPKKNKGKNNS